MTRVISSFCSEFPWNHLELINSFWTDMSRKTVYCLLLYSEPCRFLELFLRFYSITGKTVRIKIQTYYHLKYQFRFPLNVIQKIFSLSRPSPIPLFIRSSNFPFVEYITGLCPARQSLLSFSPRSNKAMIAVIRFLDLFSGE